MKLVVAILVVLASARAAAADATADYLDRRATSWVKSPPPIANIRCAMSCHTTVPYLLARRYLGEPLPGIRSAFEARIPLLIAGTATPFYGAPKSTRATQSLSTEAVLTAVALLADDRGGIAPNTLKAMKHMWTKQRADGGFDWLDFGTIEPWEAGEDWGNVMALSVAKATYSTRNATGGETRLFDFVRARLADTKKPMKMHDRVALLWQARGSDVLKKDQLATIERDLLATQRDDGGFSLAIWLGKKATKSDSYATALAVLALCDKPDKPAVAKALAWLKTQQQKDGSYPSPSYDKGTERGRRFATDAATAYATLAFATCK